MTVLDIPSSSKPLLRTPEWTSTSAREVFASTKSMNQHFSLAVSTLTSILREETHELKQDEAAAMLKTLASRVADELARSRAEKDEIVNKGGKKAAGKRANVMAPIRFALTAREKGASLAEIMSFLGREECVRRLELALKAM